MSYENSISRLSGPTWSMAVLSGTPTHPKESSPLKKLRAKWHLNAGILGTSNYLKLDLPSLEQRRTHLKLCLLYKIVHNLCYTQEFFPIGIIFYNSRMNSLSLYQPFARTNAFYFSYVPHTISLWNSLDSNHVSAQSISEFKRIYL